MRLASVLATTCAEHPWEGTRAVYRVTSPGAPAYVGSTESLPDRADTHARGAGAGVLCGVANRSSEALPGLHGTRTAGVPPPTDGLAGLRPLPPDPPYNEFGTPD